MYNTIWGRDILKESEGAERRRGTPPRLFWAELDVTAPVRREYMAGREGSGPLPAARVDPGAAHYRGGREATREDANGVRGGGTGMGLGPY